MVDVGALEAATEGQNPTHLIAMPVSLVAEIAGDYRKREAHLAQLNAASAIGDIGQVLAR